MPKVRPVVLNQADLGEMPPELQAALIMHASKKVVDTTADLMKLTEKLYNMYWMTLSVEMQQRVIAQGEHAAIKEAFDLLRLKNLVESTFSNPPAGGVITSQAIEKAQSTYQTCCQFERESLAQYYKRFVQTLRQVNGVLPEAMRHAGHQILVLSESERQRVLRAPQGNGGPERQRGWLPRQPRGCVG